MKNANQYSKLDNLIIKLLGNPNELQDLPEEPNIVELAQKLGSYIERNKKSIYLLLFALVVINILTNLLNN